MRTVRIAFVLSALTCGTALLLKMVAIVATGGADSEAAVIGVLYLTGIAAMIVAAGTGAALLLGRAPAWVRVVGGIVAAVVAFPAQSGLGDLVKAVYSSDGWFRDEVALVIIALLMTAIGLRVLGPGRPTSPE